MSDASFYSRDFHHFLPKAGDEEPGRVYWLYKPHLEPWYQGRLVVGLKLFWFTCGRFLASDSV